MPEKKSDSKYRRSPTGYAENFFTSHRKNMAEVFGKGWKNEDKLFQYTFSTAYGKLSGEFAELKANIGEGAPALVYMNDGRVLKGEATYHGGVTMNVTHREFPLLRRSRVVTETINLADTAMLYVRGGEDYLPTRTTPARMSPSALDEHALFNLCQKFSDDALGENGKVVEYNTNDRPSEIKDLWGEKVLVVDYSGKILQGEGYYESKTRDFDPDDPDDFGEYPAILIHTGDGNNFKEVPLYSVSLMFAESGVVIATGCNLNDMSRDDAVTAIRERVLQYRPTCKEDGIPEAVYEARMSNVLFAEKEAEKFCGEDPEFKAAFFGYKDKNETDEKATARMMLKIAAKDDDESVCENIFRASAWGDGVPEKTIKHLARESVNLVCDIREKIADFKNGETLKKSAGGLEK